MIQLHRAQWYLKIPLTDDLSIRFYYLFQDRPDYQGRWFLKSHNKRQWAEISYEAAQMIAAAYDKDIEKDAEEIIGRSLTHRYYRKIKLKDSKEVGEISLSITKNAKDEWRTFKMCNENESQSSETDEEDIVSKFLNEDSDDNNDEAGPEFIVMKRSDPEYQKFFNFLNIKK